MMKIRQELKMIAKDVGMNDGMIKSAVIDGILLQDLNRALKDYGFEKIIGMSVKEGICSFDLTSSEGNGNFKVTIKVDVIEA